MKCWGMIMFTGRMLKGILSALHTAVLEESLRHLNPDQPEEAMADALNRLKNFENGDLIQKYAVFMDYLQNGVPVRYRENGEDRSTLIYLADYQNPGQNSWIVANQ